MEASAAARYIGCVDAILAAGLYWYALRAVAHKAEEGLSLHSELQTHGSELRLLRGLCHSAEEPSGPPIPYVTSSDGETAGPQVLCAPSV